MKKDSLMTKQQLIAEEQKRLFKNRKVVHNYKGRKTSVSAVSRPLKNFPTKYCTWITRTNCFA